MKHFEKDAQLYLLVDIDDLLVRSSDKLQAILDEKTNFKTNTLRMLEQLNRNCKYLLSQVKKECALAQKENRKPNLSKFPIFDNFKLDDARKWYTDPIEECQKYVDSAYDLLNQFLEERDTFLEIDNLPKGQIKIFNYKKEMEAMAKYTEMIFKNKAAFHKINNYCLNEANRLVSEAKAKNSNGIFTIPEYGALVSMDTNDIIKKNSISADDIINFKEHVLYEKPLDNIKNCIDNEDRLFDIITNFNVFFTPSQEIVDYRSIHSEENVNWEAVDLVERLIHSKIFKGVYFATHHNGYREERAKRRLMKIILPEANGFIGQRFHAQEHNAIRRDRSSKIDNAVDYLMISPEQIVLLDDSKANCEDCKSKSGTEILYKAQTDSEIINGKLEDMGYNRLLSFYNNIVYGFIACAYVKQMQNYCKVKVYKK